MAVLTGRRALILGGTRGIGAAVARRLAAEGASLVLTYLSRTAEAEAFAAALRSGGAAVEAIRGDVADPAALAGSVDDAAARLGGIDVLVAVAGLALNGPLDDQPDDAFDRVFAVNVRAPFLAAKRVARRMADGGRIVFVGSIVAERAPGPGATLYAASKAALRGMTRGLSRDLGGRGITVNLVQPGPIDTERNPADGPDAEANRAPLAIRRHGTADEVAALVAWLVSPEAAFVTGSAYNIDGGWSA
jgi:3-oxoacyl-[acyl-carrier protein] reductase